jgi:hypothetical protein
VVLLAHSPLFWPLSRLLVLGPFPQMLKTFFWVISIGLFEREEVRAPEERSKRWQMNSELREFLKYLFNPKIWLSAWAE